VPVARGEEDLLPVASLGAAVVTTLRVGAVRLRERELGRVVVAPVVAVHGCGGPVPRSPRAGHRQDALVGVEGVDEQRELLLQVADLQP
jgi:hypothetical protein